LLYAPGYNESESYESALKKGVNVLLESISPLRTRHEIFQDRDIFISIEMAREEVKNLRDNSHDAISLSDIEPLLNLSGSIGASIKGLHIQGEDPVFDPSDLNRAASFLDNLSFHLPEATVFSFGGGTGLLMKKEQKSPDIPATKKAWKALKGSHPQLEFWLDPGHRIVSHAGVFLTLVTQVEREGRHENIRIHKGAEMLRRSSLCGLQHEVINFSRLDEDPGVSAHIGGPEDELGNTPCYRGPLATVKEGDVLLVTNTGAYGTDTEMGSNLVETAPCHYLCARKMCPVPL
jgi:diaminopimelate decarboxylase/aspartate kinase